MKHRGCAVLLVVGACGGAGAPADAPAADDANAVDARAGADAAPAGDAAPPDAAGADAAPAGECSYHAQCDDADPCTIDRCWNQACENTVDPQLDDGDACTADSCDGLTGQIRHSSTVPDGDECGYYACDPADGATTYVCTGGCECGCCPAGELTVQLTGTVGQVEVYSRWPNGAASPGPLRGTCASGTCVLQVTTGENGLRLRATDGVEWTGCTFGNLQHKRRECYVGSLPATVTATFATRLLTVTQVGGGAGSTRVSVRKGGTYFTCAAGQATCAGTVPWTTSWPSVRLTATGVGGAEATWESGCAFINSVNECYADTSASEVVVSFD
ncbi:MAG: hypothetical protein R2939_20995 [Kofleriaceae bacterium]